MRVVMGEAPCEGFRRGKAKALAPPSLLCATCCMVMAMERTSCPPCLWPGLSVCTGASCFKVRVSGALSTVINASHGDYLD